MIRNMVETDDIEARERYGEPRIGWIVNGADPSDMWGEVKVERVVVWNTARPNALTSWVVLAHVNGDPQYWIGFCDLDDVEISAMGVQRVYFNKDEARKHARAYIKDAAEVWLENLATLDKLA